MSKIENLKSIAIEMRQDLKECLEFIIENEEDNFFENCKCLDFDNNNFDFTKCICKVNENHVFRKAKELNNIFFK